MLTLGRCGYYSPALGAPYALWDFPGGTSGDLRLVHAATLAANPHNIQPWLFELEPARVRLSVDTSRSLGAMDPLGRERLIGLGCAVENLVVAGRALGRNAIVSWLDLPDEPERVCDLALANAAPAADELFESIAARHTNRGRYGALALDPRIPGELQRLIADEPRVALHVLTGADERAAFGRATVAATQRIIDDSEMLSASDAWYRHTQADIESHRDGVTLDAQGMSHWITAIGKMSDPVSGRDGAAYWLENTRDTHVAAQSAYVILSTPSLDDREDALRTGRAFQRIALWLTANGLACQPLNQLAERRDREVQLGLEPVFGDTLASWVPAGRHGQMLFRVGYAWDDANPSPRRALTDVVTP